jgi:hypothetical protein
MIEAVSGVEYIIRQLVADDDEDARCVGTRRKHRWYPDEMQCEKNQAKKGSNRDDSGASAGDLWLVVAAIAKAADIAQLLVLIVIFLSSACSVRCFLGSKPLHMV